MSLVKKPEMTEKNLAAHRENGAKSRGAVTRKGMARAAAANLRHGYYSKAQDQALIALGEDPKEYAKLMNSLEDNLSEGLERELRQRIGRALWRMRRAERMQDGLAMQRVRKEMQKQELMLAPALLQKHEIYERLTDLARKLRTANFNPSDADIQDFETGFGNKPPADIQELFPLLRAYAEAAAKAPAPANENGDDPTSAAAQQRASAHQALVDAVDQAADHYGRAFEVLMAESDNVRSPENIAAMMVPRDENSLLMQRMEDSSLRQLWRLTNVLVKVRSGMLTPRDVKNGDCSGDVYENTGPEERTSSA